METKINYSIDSWRRFHCANKDGKRSRNPQLLCSQKGGPPPRSPMQISFLESNVICLQRQDFQCRLCLGLSLMSNHVWRFLINLPILINNNFGVSLVSNAICHKPTDDHHMLCALDKLECIQQHQDSCLQWSLYITVNRLSSSTQHLSY